jgi:hypothetical protein
VAGLHECLLGRGRVHQQHVGVPVLSELQRLSGADRNYVHRDVVFRLELWKDGPQQPGVVSAGRRGQAQVLSGGAATSARQQGEANQALEQCGKSAARPTPVGSV